MEFSIDSVIVQVKISRSGNWVSQFGKQLRFACEIRNL